MTYLVMECHPAYAIVLDQAGRMMKVANMGYEPGQTVDYVVEQQIHTTPLRVRFASAVAAACLCIAILGGGTYSAFFVSYGSVCLRINPEVMMSVSYMDRVVGLKGLNEDGVRLVEQVSYEGKNAEEMTQLLVGRAVDMGYLSDGGSVTVWADAGSRKWKQKREDNISSGLKRQLEGRMSVEVKAGDPDKAADGTEDGDHNGPDVPVSRTDAQPSAGKTPGPENHPAIKAEDGSEPEEKEDDMDDLDDQKDDRDQDDDDQDDDDRDEHDDNRSDADDDADRGDRESDHDADDDGRGDDGAADNGRESDDDADDDDRGDDDDDNGGVAKGGSESDGNDADDDDRDDDAVKGGKEPGDDNAATHSRVIIAGSAAAGGSVTGDDADRGDMGANSDNEDEDGSAEDSDDDGNENNSDDDGDSGDDSDDEQEDDD